MKKYSVFWARVLGIFTLILVGWIYAEKQSGHALLMGMANNPTLMTIMGIFTLYIGLTVIMSHQVWKGWPVIVTVVGYWVCFKGLTLLFFPTWVSKMLLLWQNLNLYYATIPALLIGLLLAYFGFIHSHQD